MSAPRGNVLLAVCGGIAAYKACEVLRGLQKAGCAVRVVMTEDATRFVWGIEESVDACLSSSRSIS